MENWEQINWSPEGRFPGKMLAFVGLSLMLMSQAACKDLNCKFSDSLSILHQCYQLGDLIIGGIISQIYISSELITFTRYPHLEEAEELV